MRLRWALWLSSGCLVLAVAIGAYAWTGPWFRPPPAQPAISIGGPFHLGNENGRPVSASDLKGRPTVMFFGFTNCPDVCPATLMMIGNWLDQVGPAANRLNVEFVTIDPERDTPAVLKAYLASFDPRIHGLTGSAAEIARMAKEYQIYVHKEPLPGGGYTMDHSAVIYLFDKQGRFVQALTYTQPAPSAVAALKELAAHA